MSRQLECGFSTVVLIIGEGLFICGSAALNVVGAARLARTRTEGSTVVTILYDGGSRYGSRLCSHAWLEENDSVAWASNLSFL